MQKDDLTYKIIGAAMKVHNKLGPGFQEVIYQRALSIELNRANVFHVREQEQAIFYPNQQKRTNHLSLCDLLAIGINGYLHCPIKLFIQHSS